MSAPGRSDRRPAPEILNGQPSAFLTFALVDPYNDPNLTNISESPLGEQARAQHRTLLVVAAITGLVAQLDLAPKRISAVGLELQSNDRNAIRIVLLITIVYLALAFFVTARIDYERWKRTRQRAKEMSSRVDVELLARQKQIEEQLPLLEKTDPDKNTSGWNVVQNLVGEAADFKLRASGYRLLLPLSAIRAFLDFGLPLLVSAWAAGALVARIFF